ncbi:MAG: hypothetical protein PUD26_07190 [bacterium]|nr:hypothetical protein [bacterium]MDD6026372.1 hypothetical protein [bacterium]
MVINKMIIADRVRLKNEGLSPRIWRKKIKSAIATIMMAMNTKESVTMALFLTILLKAVTIA